MTAVEKITTTTREVRYNFACRSKRCGKRASMLVTRETDRITLPDGRPHIVARRFILDGVKVHELSIAPMCCGYHMNGGPVNGKTNPKIKCNAKCTGATGHDCTCACGGKNHGADHGSR